MIGGTCGWDRSRYQPVTPTGGNLTPQDLSMVDVSAGCQVGCSGREISLDRLTVSLSLLLRKHLLSLVWLGLQNLLRQGAYRLGGTANYPGTVDETRYRDDWGFVRGSLKAGHR